MQLRIVILLSQFLLNVTFLRDLSVPGAAQHFGCRCVELDGRHHKNPEKVLGYTVYHCQHASTKLGFGALHLGLF